MKRIVMIGAGIGGLTTAAVLARESVNAWPTRPADTAMIVHLPDGVPIAWRSDDSHWDEYHTAFGNQALVFFRWQEHTANAVPYFRVFNPILQGKKFDPRGSYVRSWITELAAVPDKFVHTPWEMPADMQRRAGCIIGKDYPTPIVEHALARQRMLAAYRSGGKP